MLPYGLPSFQTVLCLKGFCHLVVKMVIHTKLRLPSNYGNCCSGGVLYCTVHRYCLTCEVSQP